MHQRTDEGFRRPALPPSLTHPGRREVRFGFTDAASPLSIAWSIDLGAANGRDGQQAANNEAVPPATSNPLSAECLEKYTVPNFNAPLGIDLWQVPKSNAHTVLAQVGNAYAPSAPAGLSSTTCPGRFSSTTCPGRF